MHQKTTVDILQKKYKIAPLKVMSINILYQFKRIESIRGRNLLDHIIIIRENCSYRRIWWKSRDKKIAEKIFPVKNDVMFVESNDLVLIVVPEDEIQNKNGI
jgi:hypothetical protein